MGIKDLIKMNDEQMRIAIAKACGWRPYKPITHNGWPLLMTPPKKPNKEGWLEPIPDYLNDLNAMAEAEKMLTEEQFSKYGWTLLGDGKIECRKFLAATTRQRAIAFIKTLNLESK
jgi:hypothetical protein